MSKILKVGFSASGCLLDILDGKVDMDQVCLISAGTFCPTLEDWTKTVKHYWEYGYFGKHSLDKVQQISQKLWTDGKIHQPRNFGPYVLKSPFLWMDLIHTNEDREKNPALANAWEQVNLVEHIVSGYGIFPEITEETQFHEW